MSKGDSTQQVTGRLGLGIQRKGASGASIPPSTCLLSWTRHMPNFHELIYALLVSIWKLLSNMIKTNGLKAINIPQASGTRNTRRNDGREYLSVAPSLPGWAPQKELLTQRASFDWPGLVSCQSAPGTTAWLHSQEAAINRGRGQAQSRQNDFSWHCLTPWLGMDGWEQGSQGFLPVACEPGRDPQRVCEERPGRRDTRTTQPSARWQETPGQSPRPGTLQVSATGKKGLVPTTSPFCIVQGVSLKQHHSYWPQEPYQSRDCATESLIPKTSPSDRYIADVKEICV